MTRLTLRRGDGHLVIAKHLGDGFGLTAVTDRRRGGVGIDIADICRLDASTLQTTQQRTGRSLDIGRRDMIAIAREAPAKDLGQNRSSTTHGVLIVLDDQCSCTTAGNESIAIAVEGTAGFRRLVLARREGLQGIKRGNTIHIILFCATTDNAVLQAVLNEQETQSQRLRTTGAGC